MSDNGPFPKGSPEQRAHDAGQAHLATLRRLAEVEDQRDQALADLTACREEVERHRAAASESLGMALDALAAATEHLRALVRMHDYPSRFSDVEVRDTFDAARAWLEGRES